MHLERLFSALTLYRNNIKMLHWRTKGANFDSVHPRCDEYASQLDKFIDEVAEVMLMSSISTEECHPLCLKCAIEFLTHDENHEYMFIEDDIDYSEADINKNIGIMFDSLISIYDEVFQANVIPGAIKSKFEEHQYWLYLENRYKNPRR